MVITAHLQQARRNHRADRERGGSDVFMMLVLTTLIMFAGLAYDMGMVFNAHREATNIASAAARAGANEVSVNALYGQGVAKIGPNAKSAARARFPAGTTEVSIDISADETRIFVEVSRTHQPKILSIFGFGAMVINGEADAQVANQAP